MISNKNETSIPSAGQITSHENPHIKIGQKTQFMMSHKYLEFNCVFVVIYNEKELCRGPPRYWEWTSAWTKLWCLSWIKWSILLAQDNLWNWPDMGWHGLDKYLSNVTIFYSLTSSHSGWDRILITDKQWHCLRCWPMMEPSSLCHLFIVPTLTQLTTCIIAS